MKGPMGALLCFWLLVASACDDGEKQPIDAIAPDAAVVDLRPIDGASVDRPAAREGGLVDAPADALRDLFDDSVVREARVGDMTEDAFVPTDCKTIYDCLSLCDGDIDCEDLCVDAATPEGLFALTALLFCGETACEGLAGAALQQCLATKCATQQFACFGP